MSDKEVIAKECRFATHVKSNSSFDDMHVVKEVVHYKDGTNDSKLRMIKNYERSFWITQKQHRNHTQKKEWEDKDKLSEYKSTQRNLLYRIAKAVGINGMPNSARQLYRNPYIYGSDITSTALIKKEYQDKYSNHITPYSVAAFDIESDIINPGNDIIVASVSFKDRAFTAIQSKYVVGYTNVIDRIKSLGDKYLGDILKQRNINWEIIVVDTEVDIIKECFRRIHEWKPDFLTIWNMDYDIPELVSKLKKAGIDPKFIFSDPSIPDEYKYFRYKKGSDQKITASGVMRPKKSHEQWHTVITPASYYIIDGMCTYPLLRLGETAEPSYSLDSILDKVLGIRKLNFSFAEQYTKTDWHIFMQENYMLEYIIYNLFDNISMEMLDEKTKDLAMRLPMQAGVSDFGDFDKQPRRIVDELHFFCQTEKKIIATTSDEMTTDLDNLTIGIKGWIITLPAELVTSGQTPLYHDAWAFISNIRRLVADLDVTGSYPNGSIAFNTSKETTKYEIVSISGIDENIQRIQGLNISGGATNAIEFTTTMYGLPTLNNLLNLFLQEQTA